MSRVVCRLCGADPAKDPTVALKRVNPKGVPGIWECYRCPKKQDTKTKPN